LTTSGSELPSHPANSKKKTNKTKRQGAGDLSFAFLNDRQLNKKKKKKRRGEIWNLISSFSPFFDPFGIITITII
jgi:hypothetical protein